MDAVRELGNRLGRWLVRTPVVRCAGLEARLQAGAEIWGKMEFLQVTGTFKPRGALANVLALDGEQRRAGITAVSAGNHAIAAAFAARALGTTAKLVMIRTASPVRMDACRRLGAELVLAEDVHEAFRLAEEIRDREGRAYVHPFEGPEVTTGTATLGLEICEQVADFDAIIVPIGGGGLCSGIARAVHALNPGASIIGVEPEGADSMSRSFRQGRPVRLDRVNTIADSLGAPFALPYSYAVCRMFVDEILVVSDEELRQAMGILYRDMKMAVEPACAASTAALRALGKRFDGKKVVLVFCGSNIDWSTYRAHCIFPEC